MAIRLKCRLLLVIPIVIIVLYLTSHIQHWDTWVIQQTAYFQGSSLVRNNETGSVHFYSHSAVNLSKIAELQAENTPNAPTSANEHVSEDQPVPHDAFRNSSTQDDDNSILNTEEAAGTDYTEEDDAQSPVLSAKQNSIINSVKDELGSVSSRIYDETKTTTNSSINNFSSDMKDGVIYDDEIDNNLLGGDMSHLSSESSLETGDVLPTVTKKMIQNDKIAMTKKTELVTETDQTIRIININNGSSVPIVKLSSTEKVVSRHSNDNANVNISTDVKEEDLDVDNSEENSNTPSSLLNEHCPELSILNEKPSRKSNCLLYTTQLDTCNVAAKYYSQKAMKKIAKCKTKRYPPICYFHNSTRTDTYSHLNLVCDSTICKQNTIQIGILDIDTGKVSHITTENLTAIKEALAYDNETELAVHNTDFVFLSCRRNKTEIHQLLQLPPMIYTDKIEYSDFTGGAKKAKINVNVLVLDSVSRQHFYRVLSNSVETLRRINEDFSSPTHVLDFEAFQSLAPFTFVNLQAFLSGHTSYKSDDDRRYRFEDLLTIFKDEGYQTLLQEDACWYDKWGSILTGNRKLKSGSKASHENIWEEVRNLTHYYGVDGFGLSHVSCEVFVKHRITNLFNSKKMVCLNGRPLSTYFLDYVLNDLRVRVATPNSKPLFSYTHINIAHESSGVRIKSMDRYLQKFISKSSEDSNTLTILWSDHGAKTSRYSIDTLPGRFEVYDPFLFMIVPKTLEHIVGRSNFKRLIDNQNSLVDVVDLRNTLIKVVHSNSERSEIELSEEEDLMSEHIHERSNCEALRGRGYSLCKCLDGISFPSMSNEKYQELFTWLGEFAIGYLNNRLFDQRKQSARNYRCQRLEGDSITNVVKRNNENGTVYIFDVNVMNTVVDRKETFNFQLLFNTKRNEDMELLNLEHWMRVSIYNTYSSCKDKNVSIELCICSKEKKMLITEKYIRHKYKQFGAYSIIEPILNSPCLFLLKRSHGNVASFEVANICENNLDVTFGTKVLLSWQVAQSLPIKMTVKRGTVMFLTTFMKGFPSNEEIIPQITTN